MAMEHALLGLLALEPRHGYELSKEFADATVLGEVVHLEPGMLYAHLKKLERLEWVSVHVEIQGSRPTRKIFELTTAGKEELDRWLREPVAATRDIRIEFLLKLYLARQTNEELAAQLAREQRTVCDHFIASLKEQLADEGDDFRRLVLEMRLVQNQALARWLDQAAQKIPVASA